MEKLRIGIIGAGSIAGSHLRAYKQNPVAELTGIYDINTLRAHELAQEYGVKKNYASLEEMLQSPEIDAVSVTTWNHSHAPIVLKALAYGKHVLCEKPPALNASDALKMHEAARHHHKLLMYGLVRRFSKNAVFLKEYADQGHLGEIYYIKTGILRRCGHPGGWFAEKELSGGGCLIDLGIHMMDLAIYLLGKHQPVSVFGSTASRLGSRSHIKGVSGYKAADSTCHLQNVEDFANALVKFDNGATLYFETSWVMHTKSDTIYMELFGDQGGARLEPELELYGDCNQYLMDMKPYMETGAFHFDTSFQAEIDHFVDCIRKDIPCICPSEDGIRIMRILDAIYASAATGEKISLIE